MIEDEAIANEIKLLKAEIEAKNNALEAEKVAFEKKLTTGRMGDSMLNFLNYEPKKLSLVDKIKLSYSIWRYRQKHSKEIKRYKKYIEKYDM